MAADRSIIQGNNPFVHVWSGRVAGRSSPDIIIGILTRYGLSLATGDIHFGPFGKPDSQRTGNIRFNLSNDDESFALAVTDYGDIGVDLQGPINIEAKNEAMSAVFTPEELNALSTDSNCFPTSVYWAIKEALIKQEGASIWFGDSLRIADRMDRSSEERWVFVENRWVYSALRNGRGFALALPGGRKPPEPEFLDADNK